MNRKKLRQIDVANAFLYAHVDAEIFVELPHGSNAAVICRPDLSYSASQLTTYLKKPEAEHMLELDLALHYLVSTPTIRLTYHKTGTTTPKLIGY
ncbi:unnamed protein product, partial [Closterium sp. NIES-53]